MVGVSRQAISFLFVSAGAGLVSPADQTPFPLIKSRNIPFVSVTAPACSCSEQPAMSVDCVILQFTSDTDNIIMSLMSPRLALAQPFAHPMFVFPLVHHLSVCVLCVALAQELSAGSLCASGVE